MTPTRKRAALAEHFDELAAPRALLAPCLLLLLAESPGHGYGLMERLKPLGFDWNGPGPIYRELRSLEVAKLVTSAWLPGKAGPVPRVYEVTPAGRQALDCWAADLGELQDLIAEYLARFGDVTSKAASSHARSGRQPSTRRRRGVQPGGPSGRTARR